MDAEACDHIQTHGCMCAYLSVYLCTHIHIQHTHAYTYMYIEAHIYICTHESPRLIRLFPALPPGPRPPLAPHPQLPSTCQSLLPQRNMQHTIISSFAGPHPFPIPLTHYRTDRDRHRHHAHADTHRHPHIAESAGSVWPGYLAN